MYRLRDLRGHARFVAAAVVVLLALPFAISLYRAHQVQWLPSGDDALIGLRAHGVLSGHLPLVGQPSTSHLYGPEAGTYHPGPIEFYWLAIPIRLLGPTAGMLLGTAVVNLGAVLVAAWVVLRRAGPGVAAWASLLLAGVLWSEGSALLSDPISSNAGGIPLIALAATAWAVVDGDRRLLPLAVLWGSWVAQQHLAIVAPAAVLVAWAGVGVVAAVAAPRIAAWRARRSGGGEDLDASTASDAPADEAEQAEHAARDQPPARWWPWIAASVVLGAVLWSPVVWEQVTADQGNITAVVEYARTSQQEKLTTADALRQTVRALGFPPLLVRHDLGGLDFYGGPLRTVEVIFAGSMLAGLVATVVVAARRRRSLALLAATALVLTGAGLVNGRSIPASIEAFRINFYRWAFVVAWLAWTALGWAAALAARRLLAQRSVSIQQRTVRRVFAATVLGLMVVAAVAGGATRGIDDRRRDQEGFPAMRAMSDAAIDATQGRSRVTLLLRGKSAILASGPALALQLAAAGHDVQVVNDGVRFYGPHRIFEPGDPPGDRILMLTTARSVLPEGPGRVVAGYDMNGEINAVLADLVAEARDQPVQRSARADELLAERWDTAEERDFVAAGLDRIGAEPGVVLGNPTLLDLVIAGYFDSPTFDPATLAELRRLLPPTTVNDDDHFELRELTPEEMYEFAPELRGGA